MKTFPKIDIYFKGEYWCSTTRAKTCKQALKDFIEMMDRVNKRYPTASSNLAYMLKNKEHIKAKKSKDTK